jgi:DNA-binding response OmpR family regulator
MTPTPLVLNVEDFEPARFLRSRVLRAAGFEVVEAATAGEAIQCVSVAPPQVALVDIHLPDSDGYDLCRWLRESHPTVPVVLISALHLTSSARMTALAVGAHEFLPEPVPADVLVDQIKRAVSVVRAESPECWILTDTTGAIIQASAVAGDMLHYSADHLRGRHLVMFLDRDRAEWHAAIALARDGHVIRRTAWVRPRDRRALLLNVDVACELQGPNKQLRWTFNEPTPTPPPANPQQHD